MRSCAFDFDESVLRYKCGIRSPSYLHHELSKPGHAPHHQSIVNIGNPTHCVMKLLVLVLPFASAFKVPISPKLSATAVALAAPLPALAVYEPIHKVLPGTECE